MAPHRVDSCRTASRTPKASQGPTQQPVPPQGSPEGAQRGRDKASGQAAGAQALGRVLRPTASGPGGGPVHGGGSGHTLASLASGPTLPIGATVGTHSRRWPQGRPCSGDSSQHEDGGLRARSVVKCKCGPSSGPRRAAQRHGGLGPPGSLHTHTWRPRQNPRRELPRYAGG